MLSIKKHKASLAIFDSFKIVNIHIMSDFKLLTLYYWSGGRCLYLVLISKQAGWSTLSIIARTWNEKAYMRGDFSISDGIS